MTTADDEINRVIFVGVIHTDLECVNKVKRIIQEIKPAVVAVELDKVRYEQLHTQTLGNEPQEKIASGDIIEGLMYQIAELERNLGDLMGSQAGSEMLAAIEEGRKEGAKIALVDRPMNITIQSLMRVPLNEIYKFAQMLPEATKEIDDGTAQEFVEMLKEDKGITKALAQFREEFPNLANALIDERDEYIANALKTILNDVSGKIVAVVGAGHIEGVKRKLCNLLEKEHAS